MRAFVTGGGGFIGGALVRQLRALRDLEAGLRSLLPDDPALYSAPNAMTREQ